MEYHFSDLATIRYRTVFHIIINDYDNNVFDNCGDVDYCDNDDLCYCTIHTDRTTDSTASEDGPSLEKWLHKWQQKKKKKGESDRNLQKQSASSAKFVVPPGLPLIHELPPSLRPPPPGGYPELLVLEWG